MAETSILCFCQKVFDVGLGNKMTSIRHEAPQGEMKHITRAFHQFGVHLEQVDNATLVNPRNQQKWAFQDLAMQIYSP